MKEGRFFFTIFLLLLFAQGCSHEIASKHPQRVDIEGLKNSKGVDRDYVLSQCGLPISSYINEDGGRTETYSFYEGSSGAGQRGMFHLLASLATFGLWEAIAYPSELAARGDRLNAKAVYDDKDKLVSFQVIELEPKNLEKVPQ
jgi:hypothetical protein